VRVLVDCNVLIDVIDRRRVQLHPESGQVLDWCERNPGSGFVAWHSLSNLYYVVRKEAGDNALRQFLKELLGFMEVPPTGTAQAKHALGIGMADFEDALQAAAAIQAGVDYIVTRNTRDYRGGPIPALLPAEFIALAPSSGSR
jgi:predicted nucleic acid-binding protein